MKRYHILQIVLLFTTVSLFSQSNGNNGFIITNSNDTIYGSIDLKTNGNEYSICRFKYGASFLEYGPTEILAYGIPNEKLYQSGIIENFFVESIVSGELSLYKLNNSFYINKRNEELYKLELKQVVVKGDGREFMQEDLRWKSYLTVLVSDCLTDLRKVQSIKYSLKNITDVVVEYNECKGENYIQHNKNIPWIKVDKGLVAGFQVSKIKLKDIHSVYDYIATEYSSIDPIFGGQINVGFPRLNNKINITSEVYFTKSSYTGFISTENTLVISNHYTTIDISAVTIPLSLEYVIHLGKYPLFIQAGLGYNKYLSQSSTRKTEIIIDGELRSTIKDEAITFHNSLVEYHGGLAFKRSFEKCSGSIEIRYNNPISGYSTFKGFTTHRSRLTFSFLLSI